MQLTFSVCLCRALQPFGHALVEAGKAFFGMEQERSALRGLLEIHAGKCFDLFWPILLFILHSCTHCFSFRVSVAIL